MFGCSEDQAQKQMDYLIIQTKATKGIIKELKDRGSTAWAGAMNNICNRAEEIVRNNRFITKLYLL